MFLVDGSAPSMAFVQAHTIVVSSPSQDEYQVGRRVGVGHDGLCQRCTVMPVPRCCSCVQLYTCGMLLQGELWQAFACVPANSILALATQALHFTGNVWLCMQAYLKDTCAEVSIMPLWTEGEVQPAGSQLHGRVAAVMLYMRSAV